MFPRGAIVCLVVGFWAMSALSPLWGADFYFSSRLKFQGYYDDNVAFTYYPEEDFYLVASPSFFSTYKTERFGLTSRVGMEAYQYMDHTELNTVNYSCDVNSGYKWGRRLDFTLHGSAIKDTTLESELRETGIVRFRQDRHRYVISPGLTYALNELTRLSLNFSASRTEYEWKYNVDYDEYTVSGTLERNLRNQRDTFLSQVYYTKIDSENSLVHNYGFLLGWQRLLSPTSTLRFLAGMRYTRTEYYLTYLRLVFVPYWPFIAVVPVRRKETEHNWGSLLDLSWERTAERSRYRLGVNKTLVYSSFGQSVDRWRVSASWVYHLTPRWDLSLYLFYARTSSSGGVYKEKNTYYSLSPSLRYLLTERWSLELGYKYADFRNRVTDREYDRQQVWVRLILRFGRPPTFQ